MHRRETRRIDQVYTDYLNFYRRGPYAPYLKEHRLAGSAFVRLLAIAQPAGQYPAPPTSGITIQMITRGAVKASFDIGAGRISRRTVTCLMGVLPQGVAGHFELDGAHELLVTAIPHVRMQSCLEEVAPALADFGRLHSDVFHDPFVEGLCRRM